MLERRLVLKLPRRKLTLCRSICFYPAPLPPPFPSDYEAIVTFKSAKEVISGLDDYTDKEKFLLAKISQSKKDEWEAKMDDLGLDGYKYVYAQSLKGPLKGGDLESSDLQRLSIKFKLKMQKQVRRGGGQGVRPLYLHEPERVYLDM
jgi:hypothetical protein